MNLNFLRRIKNRLKSLFGMPNNKQTFAESDLIYSFFCEARNSDKIMVDVGAHFGESFSPYEKLGWNIYAFEPNDETRHKIKINSNLTKVFDFAITNVDDQEMSFYKSDVSTGIAGLSSFHPSHQVAQTVKTKKLSTFCNEHSVKKIDYLKIDTEGFDLFVLEGFDFEKYQPEVIMCEFEDIKTKPLGYTYKDLGGFLTSKGYQVYISEWQPILRYGISHTWTSIKEYPKSILSNENGWGNFIAVRTDKHPLFDKKIRQYLDKIKS